MLVRVGDRANADRGPWLIAGQDPVLGRLLETAKDLSGDVVLDDDGLSLQHEIFKCHLPRSVLTEGTHSKDAKDHKVSLGGMVSLIWRPASMVFSMLNLREEMFSRLLHRDPFNAVGLSLFHQGRRALDSLVLQGTPFPPTRVADVLVSYLKARDLILRKLEQQDFSVFASGIWQRAMELLVALACHASEGVGATLILDGAIRLVSTDTRYSVVNSREEFLVSAQANIARKLIDFLVDNPLAGLIFSGILGFARIGERDVICLSPEIVTQRLMIRLMGVHTAEVFVTGAQTEDPSQPNGEESGGATEEGELHPARSLRGKSTLSLEPEALAAYLWRSQR